MLSSLPTHLSAELPPIPPVPASIPATPSQAQDLASVLAEFPKVPAGPFLQPLQLSVDGGPALMEMSPVWCQL